MLVELERSLYFHIMVHRLMRFIGSPEFESCIRNIVVSEINPSCKLDGASLSTIFAAACYIGSTCRQHVSAPEPSTCVPIQPPVRDVSSSQSPFIGVHRSSCVIRLSTMDTHAKTDGTNGASTSAGTGRKGDRNRKNKNALELTILIRERGTEKSRLTRQIKATRKLIADLGSKRNLVLLSSQLDEQLATCAEVNDRVMKTGDRSNEDTDINYIRHIDEEVRHVFDEIDFYITSHRSSKSTTSSAEAVRRLKAVRPEGWPQEPQSIIKPSDSVSTSSGGSSLLFRQLPAEKERRNILDESVSQLQESIRRIESNLAVVVDSRTAPQPHVMHQRATSTGPTPPITSGARDRVIDSSRWSFTEPRLPTVDNRSSSIFPLTENRHRAVQR